MKKMMRLVDLLYKMYENTTIWVAEDPANSEGVYFGAAGEIRFRTAAAYEVVEFYPECYPARNTGFSGHDDDLVATSHRSASSDSPSGIC